MDSVLLRRLTAANRNRKGFADETLPFPQHQRNQNRSRQICRKPPCGDVIAYTGDLGAGKTAFTRGLAKGWASRKRSPARHSLWSTNTGETALSFTILTCIGSPVSTTCILPDFDYLDEPDAILAIEWSEISTGSCRRNDHGFHFLYRENDRKIQIFDRGNPHNNNCKGRTL